MDSRSAVIHLDNFIDNLNLMHGRVNGTPLCLAVKSDAYGHGAVEIARVARDWGTEALGVATIEEARELREAGIGGRIIMFGVPMPDDYPALSSLATECFLVEKSQLPAMSRAAALAGHSLGIHLKVDTGMGRIGCQPDEALGLANAAVADPHLSLRGLCTHFSVAEEGRDFTRRQVNTLVDIAGLLKDRGIDYGMLHAANSAGLNLEERSILDMVRPGIMAYGYSPGPSLPPSSTPKPVMELRSRLSFVKKVAAGTPISYGQRWSAPRETWIGTVSIGYGDGLPRRASNQLEFLVEGKRVPQVGTICMDQCMVDLGIAPPPPAGTEVIVFGPGLGNSSAPMTAQDIAQAAGTISYEVLCGISRRVPRRYCRPGSTTNKG